MDWNNFFPGILLVIFGLFGMLFGHTGLAVEALLEGLEGVSAFMFMFGLILIIPSILKGGLPSQLDKLLVGLVVSLAITILLTFIIMFAWSYYLSNYSW